MYGSIRHSQNATEKQKNNCEEEKEANEKNTPTIRLSETIFGVNVVTRKTRQPVCRAELIRISFGVFFFFAPFHYMIHVTISRAHKKSTLSTHLHSPTHIPIGTLLRTLRINYLDWRPSNFSLEFYDGKKKCTIKCHQFRRFNAISGRFSIWIQFRMCKIWGNSFNCVLCFLLRTLSLSLSFRLIRTFSFDRFDLITFSL